MEVPGGGIDVAAACRKAMGLLGEGGLPHGEISERTGLSAGAVAAVADAMSRLGATAEGGWASLPDDAKFSLIKSECYPVPTRDAWNMARLLGEGAVGPGSAVRMFEDRAMRDLVRSGHARRAAGGRLYLYGTGPSLAGAIREMYPEIDWDALSRPGGVERRARELVGMAAGMPAPGLPPAQVEAPAR